MASRKWQVAAYGPADNLQLASFNKPDPKQGEVVVKVLSTTATYTDLMIITGNYTPKIRLPATPGYDAIGIVESIGTGVNKVAVGDRIAIMPQGLCLATHVLVPQAGVVKVRADVPADEAVAVVLTGVTAYQMLHRCGEIVKRLQKQQSSNGSGNVSILVHGCVGGTGAMIVELAKIAGIPTSNIYGTCSARNVAVAKQDLGITAFDYSAKGSDSWDKLVLQETNNRGVDVIFDAIVLGGYYSKGISCLARGGKFIGYGVTNSSQPGTIASIPSIISAFIRMGLQNGLWSWFDGGRTAMFFQIAERRAKLPAEFDADLRTCLDLVAERKLKPLVGRVWPFEEAKLALQSIESGSHKGKQIVHVADA